MDSSEAVKRSASVVELLSAARPTRLLRLDDWLVCRLTWKRLRLHHCITVLLVGNRTIVLRLHVDRKKGHDVRRERHVSNDDLM